MLTRVRALSATLLVGLLVLTTACSSEDQGGNADPSQVDATQTPETGVCRQLTPEDVALPANATTTMSCTKEHTAETFAAADLPAEFDEASYDDQEMARFVHRTCSEEFASFVGADESLVLRTTLSWAWFRPSEKAWDKGARWYRCDVIGGNAASATYRPLPETARGMLSGRPNDAWLSCARGATFPDSEKVPCAQKHDWRAVSAVKLGDPDDAYPGDRVMESRTNAFCKSAVKAWLNYPSDFQYGYTYFHEPEWKVGVRRSVCWAKTDK